jgi:hypothetical protein
MQQKGFQFKAIIECLLTRVTRPGILSLAIIWFVLGLFAIAVPELQAQQQAVTLPTLFHFDGSNYITLADSAVLAPHSQVTITPWVKPDFSVTNVVDTILDKRDGCGFNRSYQLGIIKTFQSLTPGTIFFAASNANTDDLFSTMPVPNDGKFHHVAGTYDGAAVKVFLDGVLVGQGNHTGPISSTSDPAVIGVQAGCGDPTYADIGPIKIFDYALPSDQIMTDGTAGFALLSGGNNFAGNQNVTGVVTASSFTGNGSALSNIDPSKISSGTAGINITGTAASALSASSALSAADSSSLGGVSASNFARRDQSNTFQVDQSIKANLTASGNFSVGGSAAIGGGTPIIQHLSKTFTLAVPTISPKNCAPNQSVAFTGASDGDSLALGVTNVLTSSGALTYFGWVSDSNKITFSICNPHGPSNVALSGTIRVDLWKH